MKRLHWAEILVILHLSALLIAASALGWLTFSSMLETIAVVTGAVCVYLVVREHVWNFPIGILSSVLFFVLFWQSRLFGDAGLQVFFMVLGFQGWYWWLRGGVNRSALTVTRASPKLWAGVVIVTGIATYALMVFLKEVKGSAPFLDAFTTALSLSAQYLLNHKKIENWLIWIVADVIYVYLYVTRGLTLTAILYTVFLALCVAGLIEWRKSLNRPVPAPEPILEPIPHPGAAHE